MEKQIKSGNDLQTSVKKKLKELKYNFVQNNKIQQDIKEQPKIFKKLEKVIEKYRIEIQSKNENNEKITDKDKILMKINKKVEKIESKLKKKFPEIIVKSEKLNKREQKQEEKKQQKHVVFNEEQNETIVDLNERKWNDYKNKHLIQGVFSKDELKALSDSLISYIQEFNLTKDELIQLCTNSSKELQDFQNLKKAWCKIAEALPNRSVQSIHNFCKRRLNVDNYSGKWSKEEEEALTSLVQTLGYQWKSIARALNNQFKIEGLSRTAENVKDKYKSMGGDNHSQRQIGEWKLEEVLKLIKSIETATQVQILSPQVQISFKIKDENSEAPKKRFKIKDSKLKVYSKTVQFEEILSHIIFDLKKVREKILDKSISKISWSAIAEEMKTKSSDDLRHYWNQKLLPLFIPNQHQWSEAEDLKLLDFIVSQKLYGSQNQFTFAQAGQEIKFDELCNTSKSRSAKGQIYIDSKSVEQCRQRWFVLMKSVSGYQPGKKIEPSLYAQKIIDEIKNKSQMYQQLEEQKRIKAKEKMEIQNETAIQYISRLLKA